MEQAIHPLDPDQHPDEGLVNIGTGCVLNDPQINVDKSEDIGKCEMQKYESEWPISFHKPLSKNVTTMAVRKKQMKIGDTEICDTETIYARAMGLQSSPRALNTSVLLSHELAPHPTSIFDKSGMLRVAMAKASLKNSLKVEVSARNVESHVEAKFLDGCAILWVVPWPGHPGSTVQDFLDAFRRHIHRHLKSCDVYLAFDR